MRNIRTAAGFEPMPRKMQSDKMLSVTLGIHIKQKQVSWPAPLAAANTSRLPRSAMEGPMRNTRTAAGFEPMPSKMQSNKMLPVTFGIHWNP